jgi:hypothetical protein
LFYMLSQAMSSETTSTFQTFSTVLAYKIILWGVERCIHHSKPVKLRNTRYIYRAHEAEILPDVRRGLYLQDYSHFSLDQLIIIVIVCKLIIKI